MSEETFLIELKRSEIKNQTYENKKNYPFEAIPDIHEFYRGRKTWATSKRARRPEDILAFRQRLSEKIPVEEKEHLLISYLFLSEEGYMVTQQALNQIELQSPLAKALWRAIRDLEGQWQSLNQLIQKLNDNFHATESTILLQFLAHRVMAIEMLQDSIENGHRGLKSLDDREKLKRDVQDRQDDHAAPGTAHLAEFSTKCKGP